MFTYILTPPLGANFFPKKSLHLERPTSLFFGPSVKFCRFFFYGVPYPYKSIAIFIYTILFSPIHTYFPSHP